MKIYENDSVFIEIEESEIPWLKIFTQKPYKEFSEVPQETKREIWRLLDIVEKEMLSFYHPDKINIASFGNYVPHVHFHVMARFHDDSFFPEPMWGQKQREGSYRLEAFDLFLEKLRKKL
ncbi:MAG: HIT family protein [Sulfurospirillum sp.]|nr:MAG: HIT family protein [Sulfurospirillum sp.]